MMYGLILGPISLIRSKFHLPLSGALINIEVPGFGMSVVRGPTGHK